MQLLGDAFALVHELEPALVALGPAVLDGDRGLIGERLDEADGLPREDSPSLLVGDHQRPGRAAAHAQRDEDRRTDPSRPHHRWIGAALCARIVKDERLAGAHDLTRYRPVCGHALP